MLILFAEDFVNSIQIGKYLESLKIHCIITIWQPVTLREPVVDLKLLAVKVIVNKQLVCVLLYRILSGETIRQSRVEIFVEEQAATVTQIYI